MSPDGSSKPLPEERLLSLIRGKSARPSPAAAPAAGAPTPAARVRSVQSLPWPRILVTGLGILLAIEVLLLAVEAMRPLPTVRLPEPAAATPAPALDLPRPPSLAESAGRELFAPPDTAAPTPGTPSAGPSDQANQLAARLSLLGIVEGNPPQAIIEDAQTKKTHFVSPGQAVVDGALVKEVFENRVILDLRGEQIELSL